MGTIDRDWYGESETPLDDGDEETALDAGYVFYETPPMNSILPMVPQPCPSCGHCPTCGRSGGHINPQYPYTTPYVWMTTGTGTIGTVTSTIHPGAYFING